MAAVTSGNTATADARPGSPSSPRPVPLTRASQSPLAPHASKRERARPKGCYVLISSDWKSIEGFPSYRVTRHGAVVSLKGRTPRALRLERHTTGYLRVTLCEDAKKTNRYVHQLVAEAYHGPRPEGMEVCHNDGDRANNHADNLRWDTHADNIRDCHRHGTGRNQWGPWGAVSA